MNAATFTKWYRVGWCALLLVVGGALTADNATKDPATPEAAWETVRTLVPGLVKRVSGELLVGKNINKPSLVYTDYRYRAKVNSGSSYGQTLSAFYFDRIIKVKTIAETFETVRSLSKSAARFRTKNKPLLADAERVEHLTRVLREALGKNPADAAKLKAAGFDGTGTDELSTSLRKLYESAATDRNDDAATWAAEAHGAASRLVDILRWVDLQTEWLVDLCSIFEGFRMCVETSDRAVAAAGGWKPFMFGRAPGASSILELSANDALACETLLCNFLTTSETDSAVMGKLKSDADGFSIIPAHRAAFIRVRNALSGKARGVFTQIPQTPYELTAFNLNLQRYDDEKQIDQLITSLKRYSKRYSKPTVTQMMEVVHIAQGAFGSTTSARDRHHKQMVEWASRLKGRPENAVEAAHNFTYAFYTKDGRKRYRGALWTMHTVFEKEALDCIRGSQMMGSIYANAGYAGLHPMRICRGNLRQRIIATSGHTFVCAHLGKGNICLDSLVKRPFLRPFEKMHERNPRVLSTAKGYRTLDSFAAGEIRFPQGPLRPVRLHVPYYNMTRRGLKKSNQ